MANLSGLAESIGRTNAVGGLSRDLFDVSQGIRQQAEREKTGEINRQLGQVQINKAQQELATTREQTRRANRAVLLEDILGAVSDSPKAREFVKNRYVQAGAVEDNGGILTVRAGIGREVLGALRKDTNAQFELAQIRRDDFAGQLTDLNTQVNESAQKLQASGKDMAQDKNHSTLVQQRDVMKQGFENAVEVIDNIGDTPGEVGREAEAKAEGIAAGGGAPISGRAIARTETFIGDDGKAHVMQFNPETRTFDIDLGLAPRTIGDVFKTTRVRTRILEQHKADPSVRKAESMISSAEIILVAADSGNPVAHNALATFMARASGEVGNLSEADKAPFGGSRALKARISQSVEELNTGLRTPENAKFITELAQIFRSSGERAKDRLARQRAKQFGEVNENLTEAEILGFLSPLSLFKEVGAEQRTVGNTELDDINAEIERLERKQRGE